MKSQKVKKKKRKAAKIVCFIIQTEYQSSRDGTASLCIPLQSSLGDLRNLPPSSHRIKMESASFKTIRCEDNDCPYQGLYSLFVSDLIGVNIEPVLLSADRASLRLSFCPSGII